MSSTKIIPVLLHDIFTEPRNASQTCSSVNELVYCETYVRV